MLHVIIDVNNLYSLVLDMILCIYCVYNIQHLLISIFDMNICLIFCIQFVSRVQDFPGQAALSVLMMLHVVLLYYYY
jgi:hypothetical protein